MTFAVAIPPVRLDRSLWTLFGIRQYVHGEKEIKRRGRPRAKSRKHAPKALDILSLFPICFLVSELCTVQLMCDENRMNLVVVSPRSQMYTHTHIYILLLLICLALPVLCRALSTSGQARAVNRHGLKMLQQRVIECLLKLQRHMVRRGYKVGTQCYNMLGGGGYILPCNPPCLGAETSNDSQRTCEVVGFHEGRVCNGNMIYSPYFLRMEATGKLWLSLRCGRLCTFLSE